MATRILIADDHSFVREGAGQLIAAQDDLSVVGTVDNGNDLIQQARALRPDVIVLDISMPDINGLDLLVLLPRVSPASRVVILSFHREPMMVERAMSSGAKGYVAKTAPVSELVDAIRAVVGGRTYLSSHIEPLTEKADDAPTDTAPQPYDLLSEREQQVFRLVVHGKTNQQIGALLCISPRTVEKHRAAVMHKLGIKDTIGLMRYAVRLGVVLTDD
ncbi:MAG TPA: response regulator transcription factor [Hyphomicrobiaceae bacterium]|nr:response regulator transcription factor [Hyphomicrobiaceae bacterium]